MKCCAIPGCFDPCRSGDLMCRWHWAMVPAAMQKAMWATWRACRVRGLQPKKVLDLVIAHRQAVKDAVRNVCEQLGLEILDEKGQP